MHVGQSIPPSALKAVYQQIKKLSLAFLFLALTLSSQSFGQTLKQVAERNIHNFSSLKDAEDYADNLIREVRAFNAAHPDEAMGVDGNPIQLFHVHKSFSRYVKVALTRVLNAGIKVQSNLIDPDKVLEEIEDAQFASDQQPETNFLGLGSFTEQEAEAKDEESKLPEPAAVQEAAELSAGVSAPTYTPERESIMKNLGRRVRYLFHLPEGFTFWVKSPRTWADRIQSARVATIASASAALSIGLSFYLGKLHTPAPEIIGAATGLFTWVWINIYWVRSIRAVMSQGKAITFETDNGKLMSLRPAMPFIWTANFFRGLLTTCFIMLGRFGTVAIVNSEVGTTEAILSALALTFTTVFSKVSLQNVLLNVFARSQIDQRLTRKTPNEMQPQGTPGKWSNRKANIVWAVWEFLYGAIKNLDLLRTGNKDQETKYSSVSAIVYKAMALGNTLWMIWDMRASMKGEWTRLKMKWQGKAPTCEAFFVLPQPLPMDSQGNPLRAQPVGP